MRFAPVLWLLCLSACQSRRAERYLDELETCSATTQPDVFTSTTAGTTATDTTTGLASTAMSDTVGMPTATDTTTTTTATSGAAAGDTTTGEPLPVCGDGVLDDFGPLPEECDDGNLDPDDGCSASCAVDIRVFVSSKLYEAGDLDGIHLADASCANLAAKVGEPEFIKYRAWLSDSTTDARDHLNVGRGRLVLFNGLVFADSWDALLAGQLQSPLEVTEKLETYHGGVWTGTRPDGTAVPGSTHCDDWTSISFQKSAYYGYSDRMTAEWTLSALDDNPTDCISNYAIYCFKAR